MVDQLNTEKKGILTITIVTSPFEEKFRVFVKEQGVAEMALVVVQHPIGSLNLQGIQRKVQLVFPEVPKAAQEWQPAGT